MFRKKLNFLTPNLHEFCANIQMPYFPAPYLSAFLVMVMLCMGNQINVSINCSSQFSRPSFWPGKRIQLPWRLSADEMSQWNYFIVTPLYRVDSQPNSSFSWAQSSRKTLFSIWTSFLASASQDQGFLSSAKLNCYILEEHYTLIPFLPLIPILYSIDEGESRSRIHNEAVHKNRHGAQAGSVFRPFHNLSPVDDPCHLYSSEAKDGLREDEAQLVCSFVDRYLVTIKLCWNIILCKNIQRIWTLNMQILKSQLTNINQRVESLEGITNRDS